MDNIIESFCSDELHFIRRFFFCMELCNLGKFSALVSRWPCFPGENSQSVMHFQLACLPHRPVSVVFSAASGVRDAGYNVANVSCWKCYALFARMAQNQCLMRRYRLTDWCVWCSRLLSGFLRKIWIWGCIPQSSCLYRASVTSKTLYCPTDAHTHTHTHTYIYIYNS